MKILLTAINSKYIHSNLAVYSLKASAGACKEHVAIAEYTINQAKDLILQEIYLQHPDVLCFSVYIWNRNYVEEIAAEFHKLCPSIPIWVGGPEVSYDAEDFLKSHTWAFGVMIGEGEATFREVCEYYCASCKNLESIAGLAFKKEDKICATPLRMPLDLSTIPFPYEDLKDFENRIIYYESSRGCPFSCSYCLSSIDKKLRFRNPELVKKELGFFLEHNVPQVKFVDRTFNCSHAHAMEIWRYIADHDNGITNFHFEISADLLKQEELDLIATMRPGLIQLEIGVQSTNEATIHEIHRTMALDRLKGTVKSIQTHGNIHQHLDLIAGLPYEDLPTFARSFNDIYALKPNQLQMGFLKVLKGSYMYEHAHEYACVYHSKPPYEVLSTRWLSYDDVLLLKRVEEMLEVYYNSGQYEVTMKVLEPLFPDAFSMYEAMGEHYFRHDYFSRNHSRMRRCEILLEFMKEYLEERNLSTSNDNKTLQDTPENTTRTNTEIIFMLEEALTFDLYYRENCKSRPKWAPDPSTFKDMTRAHCPKGKMDHLEPFHYRFPDKNTRTLTELPARCEEPQWVLFSYAKRDPLDHQAAIQYIQV